jgi:fructose-bisphosphate aldolase, class I
MSKVQEILNNYKHVNAGVRSNLYRLMNTGELAGTGKFVIYPVDQGFEHGPARSFSPNQAGYDPLYHAEFAIESGVNAYAAPLGFIQAVAGEYPGQIPLILKVNNNDSLYSDSNPQPAITSSVQDALELGCTGIGFTIYPGTAHKNTLFEQLQEFIRAAHDVGLVAVVWSYARGEGLTSASETMTDIIAYNAHIACQMGADIVKVKPPTTDGIGLKAAEKSYEKIPINTLSERIKHVMESAFNSRRITIFSGGSAKGKDAVLDEIKAIAEGGGYGSIVGRNIFQRQKSEALELLNDIINLYK